MQEQTPWGKRYTSKATFGTCSQERASFSPHCLCSEGAARKERRVSSLYSFCLASLFTAGLRCVQFIEELSGACASLRVCLHPYSDSVR